MTNERLRGLPRAREILEHKIEGKGTRPGMNATPVLGAMSLHATAIATVELAAATQLAALADVLRLDQTDYEILLPDERNRIIDTARALLGLPPLEEARRA